MGKIYNCSFSIRDFLKLSSLPKPFLFLIIDKVFTMHCVDNSEYDLGKVCSWFLIV